MNEEVKRVLELIWVQAPPDIYNRVRELVDAEKTFTLERIPHLNLSDETTETTPSDELEVIRWEWRLTES